MNRIKKIVVVTDYCEPANNALRRAALLAAGQDAQLVLLGIVHARGFSPWSEWRATPADVETRAAQARTTLGRCAAEITAMHDVQVTVEVCVGDALEEIHRAGNRADLVVIGSRGGNALRDFVAGTPAERLVRIIRKPVLVVKQPVRAAYRRLLVALDLAEPSHEALKIADVLAGGAAVHLFHVLNDHTETRLRSFGLSDELIRSLRNRSRAQGLHGLHEMMKSLRREDVTASIGHGDACATTVEQQRRIGADLIVVGRQQRSAICSFLLGSTAQRVLAHAGSDVLVVPPSAATARDAFARGPATAGGTGRRRRLRAGVAATP